MKNRIKLLRRKENLTQVKAGKAMGVAHTTIGRWENEERNPDGQEIWDLAEVLRVHPGEIFKELPSNRLSTEQQLAVDLMEQMDADDLRDWLSIGRSLAKKHRGKTAA